MSVITMARPKSRCWSMSAVGEISFSTLTCRAVRQVKKAMPEAVTIFIVPPSLEELETAGFGQRGTDPRERILKRMERAKTEMGEKDSYDYIIVNDSVDKAAQEIIDIMSKAPDKIT